MFISYLNQTLHDSLVDKPDQIPTVSAGDKKFGDSIDIGNDFELKLVCSKVIERPTIVVCFGIVLVMHLDPWVEASAGGL
jgi:hypothetical protein